jgi:hypothetical protein
VKNVYLYWRKPTGIVHTLQGLPPQTPIVVPLATLGMQTVESMLDSKRMVLLYKWLLLPYSCVYKKVVIARLVYHLTDAGSHMGALFEALQCCRKYGLEEHVVNALETGLTMPISHWKRIVNGAVKCNESVRWQMTLQLYRGLTLFRGCINSINVSIWWQVSRCRPHLTKAIRVVMRLLSGEHGLACSTVRYRNKGQVVTQSTMCTLCDAEVSETVDHFLINCARLKMPREPLIMLMRDLALLPNMRVYMLALNSKEQTVFLLSGMGGQFILEWMDIYESIVRLVYGLYARRHGILDNVNVML